MIITILIVILLLALLAGPYYWRGTGGAYWGAPSALLPLILVIILVLVLLGAIGHIGAPPTP
jgi:hypothetical protein